MFFPLASINSRALIIGFFFLNGGEKGAHVNGKTMESNRQLPTVKDEILIIGTYPGDDCEGNSTVCKERILLTPYRFIDIERRSILR